MTTSTSIVIMITVSTKIALKRSHMAHPANNNSLKTAVANAVKE
jgi:hypothetical protein